MSHWNKSDRTYESLLTLSTLELDALSTNLSRKDIIRWLSWNDPNGIYRDRQSMKELGNIMTREEGLEILLRQVHENVTYKHNID